VGLVSQAGIANQVTTLAHQNGAAFSKSLPPAQYLMSCPQVEVGQLVKKTSCIHMKPTLVAEALSKFLKVLCSPDLG
jgi:hypothetical protein